MVVFLGENIEKKAIENFSETFLYQIGYLFFRRRDGIASVTLRFLNAVLNTSAASPITVSIIIFKNVDLFYRSIP